MRIDDYDNFTELISDRYFGIILDDPEDLNTIEYKVLAGQKEKRLATVYRCFLNGRTELFYLTGNCRKLTDLLPAMKERQVLRVIRQICECASEIRQNSFLSCDALLLDADKLYFDPGENRVKLIYLPVDRAGAGAHARFSDDLCDLAAFIADRGNCAGIREGLAKLRDRQGLAPDAVQILALLRELDPDEGVDDRPSGNAGKKLRLAGADGSEIIVNKKSFLLGRNSDAVDGVIAGNRRVGRVHCRLDHSEEGYLVTDLDSLNGTFVNEKRLSPGVGHPLVSGDELRIADVKYKVTEMPEVL